MAAAWACEMTALEKPWHPTSSSRQDRCRAGRRCRSWPAECARCAGCRPRRPLPGSRTRTNPRLRNPVPPSAACEKTCPTTQRRPEAFGKVQPERCHPSKLAPVSLHPRKAAEASLAWRQRVLFRSQPSKLLSVSLARSKLAGLPGTAATGCPPCWLRTVTFRPACTA